MMEYNDATATLYEVVLKWLIDLLDKTFSNIINRIH